MFGKYSNFSDLPGLLVRMLMSGSSAAYATLLREATALAITPLDGLLSLLERRHIESRPPATTKMPLLLLVGPPRSGTTLVYQVLSQYLDVAYPSNLTAVFPRSPLTAERALQALRPQMKSAGSYQSYYGQTSGLTGCNDAFEIWNRWLGDNRYQPADSLTAADAHHMRQFFDAWTTTFGKPFLCKNNRNALAIQLLSECLPNAKFIVVRRHPVAVAQSLIVARRRIHGDKAIGWGLGSSTVSTSTDPLAYVDAVCDQIRTLECRIADQISAVPADRIIEITYEEFCAQPLKFVLDLATAIDGVHVRSIADLPNLVPFRVSQQQRVSDAELARIREQLEISAVQTAG